MVTRELITKKLSEYQDPYLQKDFISAKIVKNIEITPSEIKLDLVIGYYWQNYQKTLEKELTPLLMPLLANKKLIIQLSTKIESHVGQKSLKGLSNIKNIIAVASGKGGVGKSTVAVNLALALSEEGASVGILDADIYGPSQPKMLGVLRYPDIKDKSQMLPVIAHGLQSMSIGYLVDENSAMIWRGPMVSTALQQLINDTHWDNLDYLIIDLPPGTGDIQLTLAQKIPVSGAVIVTTPQDLSLLDARRANEMFRKVNVPVLGVIENMSLHTCSQCGHQEAIFGSGGGEKLASQYEMDLLGTLPLDIKIREQTDNGAPTVVSDPSSANAKIYREISRKVAAKISLQSKDYSHKFSVVVES